MYFLIEIGLANAAVASLLALLALGAGRWSKRPALVHTLWLLVLLKLLTPPLVPLSLPLLGPAREAETVRPTSVEPRLELLDPPVPPVEEHSRLGPVIKVARANEIPVGLIDEGLAYRPALARILHDKMERDDRPPMVIERERLTTIARAAMGPPQGEPASWTSSVVTVVGLVWLGGTFVSLALMIGRIADSSAPAHLQARA